MKLKTLASVIQKHFGEPFLPEGFVQATYMASRKLLKIQIGDRDIEISDSGKIHAAGTNVGAGSDWNIQKKR